MVEAELALSADGDFLALRTSNLSNIGAYPTSFIPLIKGIEIMPLTYRLPDRVRARAGGDEQHAADLSLSQRRPAGPE